MIFWIAFGFRRPRTKQDSFGKAVSSFARSVERAKTGAQLIRECADKQIELAKRSVGQTPQV